MVVSIISFRRKVNCGNFESFDLEATAAVSEDEDTVDAARALQTYVDYCCNERLDALRRPGARGGKDAGEFPEL